MLALAIVLSGCGSGIGRPLRSDRGAADAANGGSGGDGAGLGGLSGFGGLGGGGTAGAGSDVPPGDECSSVADWPEDARAQEEWTLTIVNGLRQAGLDCSGDRGASSAPAPMDPELRCAARLHARDMAENGYFSHVDLAGDGPEERIARAGQAFGVAGEAIGQTDSGLPVFVPADDADCAALLDGRFDAVGVGVFDAMTTVDLTGP